MVVQLLLVADTRCIYISYARFFCFVCHCCHKKNKSENYEHNSVLSSVVSFLHSVLPSGWCDVWCGVVWCIFGVCDLAHPIHTNMCDGGLMWDFSPLKS